MNYMTNKIVAIQGNHPTNLNPLTDTTIFLAKEINSFDNHIASHTFNPYIEGPGPSVNRRSYINISFFLS